MTKEEDLSKEIEIKESDQMLDKVPIEIDNIDEYFVSHELDYEQDLVTKNHQSVQEEKNLTLDLHPFDHLRLTEENPKYIDSLSNH